MQLVLKTVVGEKGIKNCYKIHSSLYFLEHISMDHPEMGHTLEGK